MMPRDDDQSQLTFLAIADVTDLEYTRRGLEQLVEKRLVELIEAKEEAESRKQLPETCAVLPANLIESELFGHEKGAFTGSQARHLGRFEVADGGTLFLDEIGELPLELQAKLLRVIQDAEFERLGSSHTIKVDTRILAATNRNLEEEVRNGRFREDLWYRLNDFPIIVPPLRDRRDDIPQTNWKISDKDSVAEILGLDRSTLRARMRELHIEK